MWFVLETSSWTGKWERARAHQMVEPKQTATEREGRSTMIQHPEHQPQTLNFSPCTSFSRSSSKGRVPLPSTKYWRVSVSQTQRSVPQCPPPPPPQVIGYRVQGWLHRKSGKDKMFHLQMSSCRTKGIQQPSLSPSPISP